jgi:hypothetical protein
MISRCAAGRSAPFRQAEHVFVGNSIVCMNVPVVPLSRATSPRGVGATAVALLYIFYLLKRNSGTWTITLSGTTTYSVPLCVPPLLQAEQRIRNSAGGD